MFADVKLLRLLGPSPCHLNTNCCLHEIVSVYVCLTEANLRDCKSMRSLRSKILENYKTIDNYLKAKLATEVPCVGIHAYRFVTGRLGTRHFKGTFE